VIDATPSDFEALREQLAQVITAHDALMAEHDALIAKHGVIATERDVIATERDWLKLRVKQLMARLWGRKSEKLSSEDLMQLMLALGGTEAEANADTPLIPAPERSDAEPNDEPKQKQKTRKRTRKMSVGANVERVIDRTIEVPESERACAHCGVEMPVFDYVEHERIEYIPAKLVVHVERREKRACKTPGCKCDATTAERQSVPDSPLRVGPSLLAELVESKCDDAMPIHRQCDRLRRLGFELPEPTAYGYFKYATEMILPVAEALLGHILEDPVWVGIDDTGLDVLDPKHKNNKYRGHLWCFRGSSGLIAYQFTKTWEPEEIAQWTALIGDSTHIQVDDYKGYGSIVEGRMVVPDEIRLGCMMHVRRKFFEALKLGDKRAAKAVDWIKEIYKVEEAAKGKPPEERLRLRQQHSLPLLDAFDAWVDERDLTLGKTGKLAEAVRYAKQQRVYVRRCFSDGRFEIDNGAVERAIREPAIGRKNFLFTGSAEAGVRLAAAYTLVQSCRALNINTRDYLIDIIGKLEAGWPARRLADLMPHRWTTLPK
jgi:transposase